MDAGVDADDTSNEDEGGTMMIESSMRRRPRSTHRLPFPPSPGRSILLRFAGDTYSNSVSLFVHLHGLWKLGGPRLDFLLLRSLPMLARC
eukprot:1498179-Rhodomonas_salina.1